MSNPPYAALVDRFGVVHLHQPNNKTGHLTCCQGQFAVSQFTFTEDPLTCIFCITGVVAREARWFLFADETEVTCSST